MKVLVKNNETGRKSEFTFPDNLPTKEVQRIKEYLSNGGKAKRDFSISVRSAKKAYIPEDADVTMIATAIGEDTAWVTENFYFVKMVASDTTVDLHWDKFSESVIRSLGMQYAEMWAEGEQGGRTQCIMHDRWKIVGRTYKYEIQDATNADGTPMLDENGATVKELIVYAYVNKSAQYKGESFVNFIRDGRFSKVSISAWIYGWEYIPSERSNWIPPGETEPSGYFFYPDGTNVEAIELSFVDMGANANAHIMKSKVADVTIVDETPATPATPAVNTNVEVTVEETEKTVNVTANENSNELNLNINIAEYNSMKVFWDDLPENVRKGAAIKWEEVTLKNHGDGKPFYAPDYCAAKFKNMDRTIGTQKENINDLQKKVAELETTISQNSEKMISANLDIEDLKKGATKAESDYAELKAKFEKVEAELENERKIHKAKFVAFSAELNGTQHDADAIEALNVIADSFSVSDLRTKAAALQVESTLNKEKSKLIVADTEYRPKKGF